MGIYKINKNIVLLDGRSIQIDITIPFRGELDESSDYSFASDTLIKNIYDETKKLLKNMKQVNYLINTLMIKISLFVIIYPIMHLVFVTNMKTFF